MNIDNFHLAKWYIIHQIYEALCCKKLIFGKKLKIWFFEIFRNRIIALSKNKICLKLSHFKAQKWLFFVVNKKTMLPGNKPKVFFIRITKNPNISFLQQNASYRSNKKFKHDKHGTKINWIFCGWYFDYFNFNYFKFFWLKQWYENILIFNITMKPIILA